MCAWEQKNYEMNKCLSLVHLTSRVGAQSSDSNKSTSRFLRRLNFTLIRRAPVFRSSDTHCSGTVLWIKAHFRVVYNCSHRTSLSQRRIGAVPMQPLQCALQRDREFAYAAPDFFHIHRGKSQL